ncbi:hypothetical protein ACWDA9_41030, partial [Streptomyces sp. NPDC001193]
MAFSIRPRSSWSRRTIGYPPLGGQAALRLPYHQQRFADRRADLAHPDQGPQGVAEEPEAVTAVGDRQEGDELVIARVVQHPAGEHRGYGRGGGRSHRPQHPHHVDRSPGVRRQRDEIGQGGQRVLAPGFHYREETAGRTASGAAVPDRLPYRG